MLKAGLIIAALAVSGCAQKWEPKIDPRSSTNPKEIVRDTLECERLLEDVDEYGGVPLQERNDFKFLGVNVCWWDCGKGGPYTKAVLPESYNPMAKCLSNRGHSIINW